MMRTVEATGATCAIFIASLASLVVRPAALTSGPVPNPNAKAGRDRPYFTRSRRALPRAQSKRPALLARSSSALTPSLRQPGGGSRQGGGPMLGNSLPRGKSLLKDKHLQQCAFMLQHVLTIQNTQSGGD